MAPEQATNDRLGPYTDIYAVGVIALRAARRPPSVRASDAGRGALLPRARAARRRWPMSRQAPAARARVGRVAAQQGAVRSPRSAARGLGGARGDRRRGTRALLAAGRGDPCAASAATARDAGPAVGTQLAQAATADSPTLTALPARRPRRRRLAIAGTAPCSSASSPPRSRSSPSAPTTSPSRPRVGPRDAVRLRRRRQAGTGARHAGLGGAEDGRAAGVVVVQQGLGSREEPQLITPADVGLRGPFDEEMFFGSGLASADFDGDGWTDLAIGTPGQAGRHGALRVGGRAAQRSPRADPRRPQCSCRRAPAGTAAGLRRATSTGTASATSWSERPGCRARRRRAPCSCCSAPTPGCRSDSRGRSAGPTTRTSSSAAGCVPGTSTTTAMSISWPDRPTGRTRRRPGTPCTAVGRRTDRSAASRSVTRTGAARRRSRSPT